GIALGRQLVLGSPAGQCATCRDCRSGSTYFATLLLAALRLGDFARPIGMVETPGGKVSRQDATVYCSPKFTMFVSPILLVDCSEPCAWRDVAWYNGI
ncbi:MAG: hypothetical protein KDA60_18235, partial [Planctomycetales bacterium]|nr:hypothetical protein [Planctomycetales bacterium]